MKSKADNKETQKYIRMWKNLSKEDLEELLLLIEEDKLNRRTNNNKIATIKTLLL